MTDSFPPPPPPVDGGSSNNEGEETPPVEDSELLDPNYDGPEEMVEQEFTYVTHADPMRRKDPHGIYLDDVQRRNAEIQRARVEGREPDLEDPPAIAGTPLLPTNTVRANLSGDVDVPVSKTLPVSVGHSPSAPVGDTSEGLEPNPEGEE